MNGGSAIWHWRDEVPTGRLPAGNSLEWELAAAGELNFTRRYESGWENRDHRIALERSEPRAAELSRQTSATDDSNTLAVTEAALAEE